MNYIRPPNTIRISFISKHTKNVSWHLHHKYNLDQWVHIPIKQGILPCPTRAPKLAEDYGWCQSMTVCTHPHNPSKKSYQIKNADSIPVYYGCVKAQGLWHNMIMKTKLTCWFLSVFGTRGIYSMMLMCMLSEITHLVSEDTAGRHWQ